MARLKIKFVSNGPLGEVNLLNHGETNINPAYFFVKAFYMLHGKTADVEWLPCDLTMFDTAEDQAESIIKEQPDVLALSVYIWNEVHQFKIARLVKEKLPNTTIVLGGPQLVAHKDPEFFEKFGYVDFVCYGDGEKAFQLLIDKIAGTLSPVTELINMVENLKPGYKLWPFEMLVDEEYLSTSSFLIQKEDVRQHVQGLVNKGIPKNKIVFATEFARGCMYKCSFCDWSQNLTKKVKRKNHDWRSEIDFFKELDIMVRETDANFGQWEEDYEIFDYGLSLYDPNKNFKFRIHNTAKLKKRATYYFGLEQAKLYGFRVHVSLQDINDHVLANIDRPSISWEEHTEVIKKIQRELPEGKKHLLGTQLIAGLPGQTYKSLIDQQLELYRLGVRQGAQNIWAYLDNSPAADPFYQKLHKLKFVTAYFLTTNSIPFDNLEDVYIKLGEGTINPREFVQLKIIEQHKTLSYSDILRAQLFRERFSKIVGKPDHITMNEDELIKLSTDLEEQVYDDIENTVKLTQDLNSKYGFVIFGNINGNRIERINAD